MYERTKARLESLRRYCENTNRPNPVGFINYADNGCYASIAGEENRKFFSTDREALDSLSDCSVIIVVDV